jgi:hypothetical protein
MPLGFAQKWVVAAYKNHYWLSPNDENDDFPVDLGVPHVQTNQCEPWKQNPLPFYLLVS